MHTPILSLSYLPPIPWMAIVAQSQAATIELGETYPKQSYRNRCEIAMPQGKMSLSIPVKKPFGSRSKTEDILIDNSQKWQQQHLRSIKTAYSSSPYYMYYIDDLESILRETHEQLYPLNKALISWLMDSLGLDTRIEYTNRFSAVDTHKQDYRFVLHPKYDMQQILTDATPPSYQQVFADKQAFIPMLSSIDLLFNLGPEAAYYLQKLKLSV